MAPAVAYLRLSRLEENAAGHGLGAQRRAILAACAARHLELVGEHQDAGVSAVARRRPALEAALHHVESVPGAVLVVAKLDRLARSIADYAGLLERARVHSWELLALDTPDPSTPQGRAMRSMVAVFAELERELIGARTRDALASARARGVRLGRPPALSPAMARRVLRRYKAGWSAAAIAGDLELSAATVRAFLRRRGVQLRRGRPSRRTRL